MSVSILRPLTREDWLALRRPNIGASVIGAVLGVHSYQTAYGLWALHTGRVTEDPEETAPMRRGRVLEAVALQILAEERPTWRITPNPMPGGRYFIDGDRRIAATPDAFAIDPAREGTGVVQVKSVEPGVFRRQWCDPETGEIVPPLWIACQAMVEAELTGAQWAVVAALVIGHGADVHPVEVPIHAGVLERIHAEAAAFWRLVNTDTPPPWDYARDGEAIAALYAEDNGEEIDLSGDNHLPEIVDEFRALGKVYVDASIRRDEIKAEMLAKLGTAERGRLADGRVITAKTIRRAGYTVEPSSYRTIRIKPAPMSANHGDF